MFPIGIALARLLCFGAHAGDPFSEFIRKSEPLTPAQEQKSFHLPSGFEIQLVAAEPEIGKPMNMAFDERGRLWITQSREYPFPAPANRPARDQIKVLSDFDAAGHARRITTFAEGLNIPIGLYPFRGGAIAFSIPQIWRFEDSDGDGRSDRRSGLYAGQGYDLDTHGLTSSFRRGYDGWLYADHGYRNNTTLQGTDGHAIVMNSGNTYRMKLDGSRVEQFTWGQVNPFGLMFDPLGDLFSADCHSAPIYQLLRGGYYPSFGKPHDGLGFAPAICNHSHGSTAIAGIVVYFADQFPPNFRGNSFIGNVMTCRINRDSFIEHGSTRLAREEPDFLSSDDPWFRPVDLQLGPDGAIYVADFYNRIIGHYEVPLDHPGRDRERGRIWRIIYRGPTKVPAPQDFDLSRGSVAELMHALAHPNIAVRMAAMNQLSDRVGQASVAPIEKMMGDKNSEPLQRVHGLWVLYRLNAAKESILVSAAGDADRAVRVHALRVLSETANWSAGEAQLAIAGLRDPDSFVQRAAADALGCQPQAEFIRPLLEARHRVPAEDTQLLHVVRIALRNQLQPSGSYAFLAKLPLSEADSRDIADVSLGVKSPEAGTFALRHLEVTEDRGRQMELLRHAGQNAPESELHRVEEWARTKFPNDSDAQFAAYQAVQSGFAQRGAGTAPSLRAWASGLVRQLLAPAGPTVMPWMNLPLADATIIENPWTLEKRRSADGNRDSWFISSLPAGEKLTGMLRSRAFTVPETLRFFLAGHDGDPAHARLNRNFVRLLDAASGKVLRKAPAPRNDEAQPISWELGEYRGRQAVLEIVDGHDEDAYAWMAVGRFEPRVVALPEFIPNSLSVKQQTAADLVRTVPLPDLEPQMVGLFSTRDNVPAVRAAAARALITLDQQKFLPVIAASVADTNQSPAFRESVAEVLAGINSSPAQNAALGVLAAAPRRSQTKLAQTLAATPAGAERLLAWVEQKRLSSQLLAVRQVKEQLSNSKDPQVKQRYDTLSKSLPSISGQLFRLMEQRRAGFDPGQASATRGQEVFTKNCALCHQIDGHGAVVGPQLDGVGNRGLERLIEDVLDPNRNVDPAFHYSILTLKDDTSVTGLQRREEGDILVFADSTGKEIRVPKGDIAERRESALSLMPSNFSEIVKPEEFYDLMAFLLAHGPK